MIITIIGPRSVGKSTISKQLANKLKCKYVSSDDEMDKKCTDVGGIKGILKEKNRDLLFARAREIFDDVFSSNNIVFDLAGGTLSTTDSKGEVMDFTIVKQKSLIIGLIPFENKQQSVDLLFQREQKREHWKDLDKNILYNKTIKSLEEFEKNSPKTVDVFYYVGEKSSNQIVEDLIGIIKKNATTGI